MGIVSFNLNLLLKCRNAQNHPQQNYKSGVNQFPLSKIGLLTDCLSTRLSFHPFPVKLTLPSAAPLCPAVCPVLAVLTAPRSHAMAVLCSVMANGAVPAPSQPMDRQLFFLTLVCALNFPSPQKFILPTIRLAVALAFSFPVIHFPSPPPCIADHLAGEPTEKPTDRKHTQPSLDWFCSESLPTKPRASQSVFAFLPMSPMMCLHLDSMPACEDVPSCMNKTALKTRERLTG